MRRIRRNPRVRVAPSDARGTPRGEAVDGTARLLGADAGELVQDLLRRKYWLVKPALDVFNGLTGKLSRKPKAQSEYIEIVPAER